MTSMRNPVKLLVQSTALVYGALFAFSYVAALYIQWPHSNTAMAERLIDWQEAAVQPLHRLHEISSGRSDAAAEFVSNATSNDPAVAQQQEPLGDGTVARTIDEQRADDAEMVRQQAIAKTSDLDARTRLAGVMQLAAMPSQQSITALQYIATSDADMRNRLLAIRSLVTLARKTGDTDGSIRAVLRQFVNDANPAVVNAAQSGYESMGVAGQSSQ